MILTLTTAAGRTATSTGTSIDSGLTLQPGERVQLSMSGGTPGNALSIRWMKTDFPNSIDNDAARQMPLISIQWSGPIFVPTMPGRWLLLCFGDTMGNGAGIYFNVAGALPTSYSPKLSVTNFTGSGPLVAGVDFWRVEITDGRPNATVTLAASQNGGAATATAYGTTDTQGKWNAIVPTKASDVGTWIQTWLVADDLAGSVTLQIVADSQPSPATPTTPTPPPTAPTAPATYSPTVTLANLTTGNGTAFVNGQQFRITITGAAPNAAVSITATRAGSSPSTSTIGTTDGSGAFVLTGAMNDTPGTWTQTWRAGNDAAGSLTFSLTNPAQAPAYTPHVTMANLTTGNGTAFVNGQQFRITITGAAPNAAVSITATRAGSAPSTSTIGTTDGTGSFVLTGAMNDTPGTWTQTWRAGNDAAGSVTYTLEAAPTGQQPQDTGSSFTGSDGGFFTDVISALPDPVQNAVSTVQAATADIPSVWIWGGAIGALVLWSQRKRR